MAVGEWSRKQESDFCRERLFKPVEDEANASICSEIALNNKDTSVP
jgi:hypothetical protein